VTVRRLGRAGLDLAAPPDPGQLMGERRGAGEEIGMDVRLRHVRDSHALLARGVEIRRGIAQRIDDDRLPGGLTGDEITGLGEAVVIEAAKEHAWVGRGAGTACL